jgi:Chitin recognition protein
MPDISIEDGVVDNNAVHDVYLPQYKDQSRSVASGMTEPTTTKSIPSSPISSTNNGNIHLDNATGVPLAEAIEVQELNSKIKKISTIYVAFATLFVIGVIMIGGICGAGKCTNSSNTPSSKDDSFLTRPTQSPIPTLLQGNVTCGDGVVGNRICANTALCCSDHGFCGSTAEFCTNTSSYCGQGNIGNNVCVDPKLCCSKFGFCGSTPEHCGTVVPTPSPSPLFVTAPSL